jgi:hypothetical protein
MRFGTGARETSLFVMLIQLKHVMNWAGPLKKEWRICVKIPGVGLSIIQKVIRLCK